MRNLVVVICAASLLNASYGFAQELLVEGFESLDRWRTEGQKEISFDLSDEHVKESRHSLCLHVEIDHKHAEDVEKLKYPMGWPSVTKRYKPGIDLSEYDFLELDVYFESRRGVDPDFALSITLSVADRQWHYPIWLEVYVPPGTPAGDYAAPLRVHTARGDLPAELRLHVWDFDVPIKQHFRTSTTIYGPWGWREDINKWFGDMDYGQFIDQWRPRIVEMLAKYRLCPSHLRHLPLAYDRDKDKVMLRDTSEFEQFVRSYLGMGHHFDSMPVPYFFDRDSFLDAKKGTDEYLNRITEAYRLAAEYLDQKGWLEGSYVYCVDEVVVHKHETERDFDLLNRVFDAIHGAHPKIKTFGAETPSPMLRGMDIWCINVGCFDIDVLAEQQALGNQVWWYNGYRDPRPGTRIDARGVDHRALFWMTYRYGIDGYLIWTVNRWLNNPWEQPRPSERAPLGDHFLLYPNPDGTQS